MAFFIEAKKFGRADLSTLRVRAVTAFHVAQKLIADGWTVSITCPEGARFWPSHQFDLLVVLAQSPGRVLSRDQIMDALKGHPLEAFDRSIDVHISRIRALIEDDPKSPRRVLTVRGAGYVFARKQDADDAN